MKKPAQTILKYIALVVIFLVVFTFLSVRNAKDCDKFVVDTYENASHINIPPVTFSDCLYLKSDQIRTGIYVIDTTLTDLDEYIKKYPFTPTTFAMHGELWSFDYLKTYEAQLPETSGDFYLAEGNSKKNEWQCLLDRSNGKMWFQIKWLE